MSSAFPWSHPHERVRSPDEPPTKSLTPQRKHRKLLKDGSGIEVWPESVEKIFVEGLRKYWDSPYASSQSRGRSRWRNQFLVEYLKSNGIERTKKQVASHIQVLRNMWKGEPEFCLVAGGEELYSEEVHSNVKAEEQADPSLFRYSDFDDAESSSNGTSPNFSPPEVKTEFPPSPAMPLRAFSPEAHATFYNPLADRLSVSSNSPSMIPLASPNTQRAYPMAVDASQLSMPNYAYSAPSDFASASRFTSHATSSQATPHHPLSQPPKVKALKLAINGASPSWVRLDTLTSAGQLAPLTPLTLRIKLTMSHVNYSSTAHNIMATLYFTTWISSAKCSTKVSVNGQTDISEDTSLTLATSGDGYLIAPLPDARLNQYQWVEPSLPVVITQEINLDGQTTIFIVFFLDRTASANPPSAQLVNFSKFSSSDRAAAAQLYYFQPHLEHQTFSPSATHPPALNSAHGNSVPYMYVPTPQYNRHTLPSMTC